MYENYMWHPELIATHTDEQLQRLKDARKKFAQEEQELVATRKGYETDKTLDKELKIELLRWIKEPIKQVQSEIKAATILIDYFYGTGRFEKHCIPGDFPDELKLNFTLLLGKLSD